ncbi:MAG: Mov34/MPN/PAD-1 family protein [Planctomycetota bacterium]
MNNTKLSFTKSLWFGCLNELRARGKLQHESGGFVLGRIKGNRKFATLCVYYDELDPYAYSTGVCILESDAFARLWQICREHKMTVLADIHTHPQGAYQSESDRTNPMIAKTGHLAIIVPRFAEGSIWRHELGLFRYKGGHEWTNLSGWQARKTLKVKWSIK